MSPLSNTSDTRTVKADGGCFQTLEDMDLIFGDTAAYEEKQRIVHIEAQLRGTPLVGEDVLKEDVVRQEYVHSARQ